MPLTHQQLTAVTRIRTLYGAGQPYRLKYDADARPTQRWKLLFEDKLSGTGWEVAYEGGFHETLSVIREYEMGPDEAF